MGKTEGDWNGLQLGFLKTVQSYKISKFIYYWRVSMGLTVNRQMAQNITVNRQ